MKNTVLTRLLFLISTIVIFITGILSMIPMVTIYFLIDLIIALPYWIITGKYWTFITKDVPTAWWVDVINYLFNKMIGNETLK